MRIRPWLVPALLLLCVTLPHLTDGDWQRGDSGWYTAIGVQAFRTGEFWTLIGEPGQPYFNKPPLVFWITGLIAWVFGPGALAARGPTVLAALGCVLVTVSIVREFGNRRAALASGIALALSLEFFRRTREVSLDMWQTLFLLLALWAVAIGVTRGRWKMFALAGVPLGLALLCKPLVAMVGVGAIVVWLISLGQYRRLWWAAVMTLVALLVAGPWHVSMALLHGEAFTSQYFGDQIMSRAGGANITSSTGLFFYIEQLFRNHWPWLVFVALRILALVRAGGRARLTRSHRQCMGLALAWTVVWFVALSVFADRRDRYGLVMQPGLAILAGVWLGVLAPRWFARFNRMLVRVGVPVACAGAALFAILPVRVHKPVNPQWPALFAWMETHKDLLDTDGTAREGAGRNGLWQGGFRGDHGSRLYLETGFWPITTMSRNGDIVATPPAGSLIIYHRRGGLRPGENESVVFTSGDLTVTELIHGDWSPIEFADPGEGGG